MSASVQSPSVPSAHQPALPRLVPIAEVAKWLGVSRQAIWLMINRGDLPQPHRLSKQCIRFREDQLLAVLDGAKKVEPPLGLPVTLTKDEAHELQ